MFEKLQRTLTSVLPVDKRRTGSCNQCGACCRLPNKCMFLRSRPDKTYYCAAYKLRPLNCRKFPRTQAQLNHVIETCGYSFKEEKKVEFKDKVNG